MNYLNSYRRSKLDLSHIGLQRGKTESDYFCTPVLSRVIGWAGVDGIHFCTTKGFEEMIFAVSPMNTPGNYIHPVARNFEDFLRLILACHGTAPIEQCWFMDREVFENFIADNPPTEKMRACLDAIRKKYDLTSMEDPFGYIRNIQKNFDYRQLKFPPDYYEWAPEEPLVPQAPAWKVTMNGDFFDTDPDAVGGVPVAVNKSFRWADIEWFIPEVYPFDRGLVLFVLGKIDPDAVRKYISCERVTEEDFERSEAECPLNIHTRFMASVNDLSLRPSGSTGMTWVPDEGSNYESKWVLEHYDLDLNYPWLITRVDFRWPDNTRLDLTKMSLTIMQNPISISGPHFRTPLEGESVILKHPRTGMEYTLFVDDLTKDTADLRSLTDGVLEYPNCYTRMTYRIQPELDRRQFRIADCAGSDEPRVRSKGQHPDNPLAASIGIIGGADGPTAVFIGQPHSPNGRSRMVNSSLHFDFAEEIEWKILFQEKPNEDLTVSLI